MSTIIRIKDVTDYLEALAPRSYQESYDNSGLLTGDPNMQVKGILVTLDCIESVIEEAEQKGCNMIVAHHPIIFKGLKKLTGTNYVERTVISAIRKNIAIYACHTNLDHIAKGVNLKICEKVGIKNPKILSPKKDTLSKLVTFVPNENLSAVAAALHDAGAGQIGNYKNCSFQVEGTGTFKPNEDADPYIGQAGKQEFVRETRLEVVLPTHLSGRVIKALKNAHPYEEVAYYLSTISNENQEVGAGMVGDLEKPLEPIAFLQGLKASMGLQVIRHTRLLGEKISRVAVCGGSGSFLLSDAIRVGAQAFITSDFKYHEFFDAGSQIVVADIGHYESEVFTKELLKDVLMKNFANFAINFSDTVTNPISYL